MKVLVVYTHPNPKSFNRALLDEVRAGLGEAGHEVKVKDLYSMNFKTTLDGEDFAQILSGKTPPDVAAEQADVIWADGLVFIYPIWWFSTPAALKGWIDRVLLNGFAYAFGPEGPKGLLKHRKALVLTTTGGPESSYEASNSKEIISRPMTEGTLAFCGVQNITHKNFYGLPADETTRKGWLAEARALAKAF